MRRHIVLAVGVLVASSVSAYAQAPGERIPLPQPVEGWSPTTPRDSLGDQSPRPTSARTADPWQPVGPQPRGITAGNVTLYPSVTAGAFYDDNVFATSGNRQSDWAGFVRPQLGWRSAGSNWGMEGSGFVEDRWYRRFTSEDQVNGGIGNAVTFMPGPDTQLIGRVRYLHSHEERGGGETVINGTTVPSTDRPTPFDVFEASGAWNQRYNRYWTSVGIGASWQHYDTPTVLGVPVPQNYRDGNVSVLSGRFGYVVAPLTSVFIELAGNRRNFEVDNFDSTGYRIVGGVLLEPGQGARVKGEAYVGYMNQNYTGATFQTVSTFTYGGALAWLIAPRWTAVFEGRRQALESALNPTGALNGGVSVVESLLGARLDYALLPNLIIGVGATYLEDEFKGANRTDHSVSPLVSVKYLVTPFVTLGFDYRNISFDSSGFGVGNYARNVYLFSINARI